jgi:dipeptidyl aminopeptidase/acylaminoacyl peptidase
VADRDGRTWRQRLRDRAGLFTVALVLATVLYGCWGDVRATPWASRQFLFGGRGLDGGADGSLAFAVEDTDAGVRSALVAGVDDDDAATVAEGLRLPPLPAWSPDGDRVAYAVDAGDEAQVLQVRPVRGGDPVDLVRTSRFANQLRDLAWSPDGASVAFIADLDDEGIGAAWVVPAAGGPPQRMGPDPVAIERCFPTEPRRCGPDLTGDALALAWLPDGELVLLSEIMPGDSDLGPDRQTTRVVAVPAGGGPSRLLAEADGPLDQVAASPDGRYVLYGLANGDAHVLDTTTGRSRRLADRIDTPVWSADGERLLFANNRMVMAADADGDHVDELTRASPVAETSEGSALFEPVRPQVTAWSPDRRHVAFAALEGGRTTIYVMNADGTGQSRVHRTDGNAVALQWTP